MDLQAIEESKPRGFSLIVDNNNDEYHFKDCLKKIPNSIF